MTSREVIWRKCGIQRKFHKELQASLESWWTLQSRGKWWVCEKTRQAGKDGKDSNNLKSIVFVYYFAAFKVVRAYKYLLILYIYACAFKRAREKKGLEKLMNYIE